MKQLICLLVLALSACASPEEIARKQAAEDHAFCSSVWGDVQQGYANCRMMKQQQRYAAQQNGAALSALMGMQLLQNSQPRYYAPAPSTTSCVNQGVFTNCTSY